MISRVIRYPLLLAMGVLPLVAQQEPVQEPEPPAAVPVEEEAPVPVEPDPGPRPVEPGGNVEQKQRDERAFSRSGMFRVGGGGPEFGSQRSAVALLLEKTKDNFESLMKENANPADKQGPIPGGFAQTERKLDDFKIPVDVVLVGKPGDPAQARSVIYELKNTGSAFLLGIRIHLSRGIDNELLERAALTTLLYERALRTSDPAEFEEALIVRPWLVEGLIEALKWRENRADRRIYEGVFKQGGGFTLDELFEVTDNQLAMLDGASKLTFRALSGSLVMALLEQPHGRGGFREFSGEAARFSGEMPVLLRKHFPELNLSEKSLAKWWALTLAKLMAPKLSEVFSIQETERNLNDALQFHTRDEAGNAINQGIEAWEAISKLDPAERVEAVKPADEGLTRLSYRCFPSYRPLLREYQQILRDLAAGESKNIGAQVVELAEQRTIRLQRAVRARDYMDFVEISEARELSGQFDDYVRLKKELELRPRAQRTDRVTETLDTIQKSYESRRGR